MSTEELDAILDRKVFDLARCLGPQAGGLFKQMMLREVEEALTEARADPSPAAREVELLFERLRERLA